MISQQQLVCDNSSLANFKQWGSAISAFIGSGTFLTKAADTGQVNWSTIAAVPGSGTFVYEIWKSNDGLATFYLKLEYGNVTTNCPSLRLTVSTSTDGAGNPTGYVMGPWICNNSTFTAPSSTTQYECNFSEALGRLGVMMWRNGSNNCQQFFGIERSVDGAGNYTGDHVTLVVCGFSSFTFDFLQQTLVFASGVAPVSGARSGASRVGGLIVRMACANSSTTTAFANGISFDTIAPNRGYFDWNLTMCGAACSSDLAEGVPFNVTLYSSAVTFLPSFNGPFGQAGPGNLNSAAFCMRFD